MAGINESLTLLIRSIKLAPWQHLSPHGEIGEIEKQSLATGVPSLVASNIVW